MESEIDRGKDALPESEEGALADSKVWSSGYFIITVQINLIYLQIKKEALLPWIWWKKMSVVRLNDPLKLGRHTYLPQMECVIVHAQISCLIRVSPFNLVKSIRPVLKHCRSIHFKHVSYSWRNYTIQIKSLPTGKFQLIEGVYLGSFVARRIQRAWRRYVVRRRRMALCMASNPRLGAGASPLLGAVIRVLCVEDLVQIV
jgi:hypothetical protein